MSKILILEDARIGGRTLEALQERGLEGTWLLGVKSIEGNTLTGFGQDLSLRSLSISDYSLAFVDGFLYIGGMMGWEIIPVLSKKLYTIGTSSIGEIGAHMHIEKSQMLSRLDEFIQLLK